MTGCAFSVIRGRRLSGLALGSWSPCSAATATTSVAETTRDAAPAHAYCRRSFIMEVLGRQVCGGRASAKLYHNIRMPSAPASSPVACIGGSLASVDTDLLIVPWYQDEPSSAVSGIDAATDGELARALASKEFQGKAFELFVTPIGDRA